MKTLLLYALTLISVAAYANGAEEPDYGPGFWESDVDTTLEDSYGGEHGGELPVFDEETTIHKEWFSPMIQFPQTQWDECKAGVTGNYTGYDCAQNRGISVILNNYLQQRLIACVDAGLRTVGSTNSASAIHLTHAGIAADANHSSRSLHSHKRAIDIKLIKVRFASGEIKDYDYAKTSNRSFYKSLRQCWGKTVHDFNGCPYYRSNAELTGSIGWENTDHGRHMHLSVPYCVNGAYGSGVWVR